MTLLEEGEEGRDSRNAYSIVFVAGETRAFENRGSPGGKSTCRDVSSLCIYRGACQEGTAVLRGTSARQHHSEPVLLTFPR